jgi:hypothetical protein
VRLIDRSLNLKAGCLTGTYATTFASCQVFANETNKLPLVLNVGDIIRFNRVNVSLFMNQKQFNCNVWMKSSWAIFRGYRQHSAPDLINLDQVEEIERIENCYKPIASSYQKYAFHEETEIPIIDDLRQWSYQYFKTFKIYETITRVPQTLKANSDFDVQGKILKAE